MVYRDDWEGAQKIKKIIGVWNLGKNFLLEIQFGVVKVIGKT